MAFLTVGNKVMTTSKRAKEKVKKYSLDDAIAASKAERQYYKQYSKAEAAKKAAIKRELNKLKTSEQKARQKMAALIHKETAAAKRQLDKLYQKELANRQKYLAKKATIQAKANAVKKTARKKYVQTIPQKLRTTVKKIAKAVKQDLDYSEKLKKAEAGEYSGEPGALKKLRQTDKGALYTYHLHHGEDEPPAEVLEADLKATEKAHIAAHGKVKAKYLTLVITGIYDGGIQTKILNTPKVYGKMSAGGMLDTYQDLTEESISTYDLEAILEIDITVNYYNYEVDE